jgi:hypothetical protein
MKSHRDHKYRRDARIAGRSQAKGPRPPTLLTELRRSRPGWPEVVLPMAPLTGLPVGTRLWIQVLHGAVWLNKKPIGPRGLCGRQRVSRRLRRGPPVRIVKHGRKKGCCELQLKRINSRRKKGVES